MHYYGQTNDMDPEKTSIWVNKGGQGIRPEADFNPEAREIYISLNGESIYLPQAEAWKLAVGIMEYADIDHTIDSNGVLTAFLLNKDADAQALEDLAGSYYGMEFSRLDRTTQDVLRDLHSARAAVEEGK